MHFQMFSFMLQLHNNQIPATVLVTGRVTKLVDLLAAVYLKS